MQFSSSVVLGSVQIKVGRIVESSVQIKVGKIVCKTEEFLEQDPQIHLYIQCWPKNKIQNSVVAS